MNKTRLDELEDGLETEIEKKWWRLWRITEKNWERWRRKPNFHCLLICAQTPIYTCNLPLLYIWNLNKKHSNIFVIFNIWNVFFWILHFSWTTSKTIYNYKLLSRRMSNIRRIGFLDYRALGELKLKSSLVGGDFNATHRHQQCFILRFFWRNIVKFSKTKLFSSDVIGGNIP